MGGSETGPSDDAVDETVDHETRPQPVEPRWMLVRLLFSQGAEHTMIMEAQRARELADRKAARTAGGGKGEGRRVDVAGLAKDHTSVRVVCAIDDLTAVILVEMAPRDPEAPDPATPAADARS